MGAELPVAGTAGMVVEISGIVTTVNVVGVVASGMVGLSTRDPPGTSVEVVGEMVVVEMVGGGSTDSRVEMATAPTVATTHNMIPTISLTGHFPFSLLGSPPSLTTSFSRTSTLSSRYTTRSR